MGPNGQLLMADGENEGQQGSKTATRDQMKTSMSVGGSLNLIGLYKPGATCTGGNTKTGKLHFRIRTDEK